MFQAGSILKDCAFCGIGATGTLRVKLRIIHRHNDHGAFGSNRNAPAFRPDLSSCIVRALSSETRIMSDLVHSPFSILVLMSAITPFATELRASTKRRDWLLSVKPPHCGERLGSLYLNLRAT
jgi:hypothetical protein